MMNPPVPALLDTIIIFLIMLERLKTLRIDSKNMFGKWTKLLVENEGGDIYFCMLGGNLATEVEFPLKVYDSMILLAV